MFKTDIKIFVAMIYLRKNMLYTHDKAANISKCVCIRNRKIGCNVVSLLSFFYSPLFADMIIDMIFWEREAYFQQAPELSLDSLWL